MKHLVTLVVTFALFSTGAWAQCTVPATTGSPYVSPVTDSLDCIELGIAYNEVISFEMPQAQPPVITGGSLTFDSIINIPCGIDWEADQANNTYQFGQAGCFAIFGTTTDNEGQYLLGIYITVTAQTLLGPQTWSGRADSVIADIESLVGSTGLDLEYYLRVIQPSAACPDLDKTSSANNLTASAVCAGPEFTATISGDTEVCVGDSAAITVTFTNGVPPYSILWSSGSTSATLNLAAGNYTITAVDSNTDTATATITVTELPLPTADFGASATAGSGAVTISNSSSNATTYSWDFAGLATETGATPTYTFTENGTYDITLIATNACGSDTTVESVTISGIVGINELGSIFTSVQISPNPSNGNFTLQLVANETSPVSVKVFNLQGQAVYTSVLNTVAGQASTQSIKLDNAASGIYIIQIQASDALVTQKLMVN